MDLDQIQFENAVEMELHSENPELWTVTRVTSTTVSYNLLHNQQAVILKLLLGRVTCDKTINANNYVCIHECTFYVVAVQRSY